jgi:hypothetical protein
MKKIILSIAMVAFFGLGLTSCDPDVRKCYKFTYELGNVSLNTYEWCSKNEADVKKDALEEEYGVKVSRSVVLEHETAEDCVAANFEK